MNIIHQLFDLSPFIALFITLSLGYLVGKITIGNFVLGGVAGTLLMGVLIGQFGVHIDPSVKSIFFALFIYSVGYQGGAHFFKALNFQTINILLSAVVMTVSGLLCVLAAAWLFDLDRGLAAGLAAGGLTQSAIIGTAGDAIAQLGGLSDQAKSLMQTHVAIGYTVTYIFGSLGPIIMATWVFPALMKWDLRKEAIKKAELDASGESSPSSSETNTVTALVTRAFKVDNQSRVLGKTLAEINEQTVDACIELFERDGQPFETDEQTKIEEGDIIVLTGRSHVLYPLQDNVLGKEIEVPKHLQMFEESRQLIADRPQLFGKSLRELRQYFNQGSRRDVYVTGYIRGDNSLEVTPELIVQKNDIIELTGSARSINRVQNNIGQRMGSPIATDMVIFGLGMTVGLLFGLINFKIAGIPVTIGSGAGCLISGLIIGWVRSRNPKIAALPMAASRFIRDFGLAVFIGIVGLDAGPQAVNAIKENGLLLLGLGVGVTLIPQVISFFFSYYVLKVKNPIDAMGCVAGGRSSNPTLSALMEKTGNATPVFSFTVTYAVANVLLTLWGPIIVGVITLNAVM